MGPRLRGDDKRKILRYAAAVRRFALLLAEGAGRHADHTMKGLAERGVAFIADLASDLGERALGASEQHAGAEHAPSRQIFQGGDSKPGIDPPGKGRTRDVAARVR